MLTECLHKIGIWCYQRDEIIDSDVTNAIDMREEAARILPFCVIKV